MKKISACILANELLDDEFMWINSCKKQSQAIDYFVINITRNDWLNQIQNHKFDIFLTKPGPNISFFKQQYDERVYILEKILGYQLFPTADEIFIYENKRFLSYWLTAHKIPHPHTDVFYYKQEAISFLENTSFPLVAKSNIGASGTGVYILNNKSEATEYILNTFSGKGVPKKVGPNMQKGGLIKRGIRLMQKPGALKQKLNFYKALEQDKQRHFVIFQQFVPHLFEWRAVRIGDSFFAHKKLKFGEKASGSLLKNYDDPPISLMDFVKKLTDNHNLRSVAVDIFEGEDSSYLVNEIQCIFGQSDSFQMMVGGKIGRYQYLNSNWIFEEGDFNGNECYDLRVQWAIENYNKKTKFQ